MSKFAKGISGNPSGRPKMHGDMLELARAQTARNLEVLMELRDGAGQEQVRAQAAKILHEIAWGKPSQQITGANEGPVAMVVRWALPAELPGSAQLPQ